MRKAILLILGLVLSASLWHCSNSSGGTTSYQAAISLVHANWPIVRESSGKWEVVGEVAITNTGTETIDVQTLSLKAIDANGTVLTERVYGAAKFSDTLIVISKPAPGTYIAKTAGTGQLAPTDFAFGHVAALAGDSSLPARARVTATFTNGKSETTDIPLYEFDPGQQMIWPVPFGGYDWAAMNTAEAYHHFGGIIFSLGTNTYNNGECFAVDMTQFDSQYKFSNPPDSPNKEDYYSWGQSILSAGAGTVVAVEKSRMDQAIGTADQTRTGQAGNYVVIQHGPALFSFYAHMMNNSATVNVGDAVSTGQVIGRIGKSGDATAPGLHFQFMDNEDYLAARGLPALFWNAKVKRLSDADLQSALGQTPLPDIRLQNYLLTSGTYTLNGTTPLEYDIVIAP